MKEKIKTLWKLCFEDSEEFIEMYFKLRYKDEINVAIEQNDQVISALQTVPYSMTFHGKTVPVAYISGACTHPDFRGKGVMRELLSQAFDKMHREGVLFSALIPAESELFNYYAQAGYAPLFQYSKARIVRSKRVYSKLLTVEVISEYNEEVYQYLNQQLSERSCCMQHTVDDFKIIMADLNLNNGSLVVARKKGQVVGVMISYQKEKMIITEELVTRDYTTRRTLLSHIQKIYDGKIKFRQILPPSEGMIKCVGGMLRIINAVEVLKQYAFAYPTTEMYINLSDKQIPANSGYYLLKKGKCTFSATPLNDTYIPMNINELAEEVFRYNPPFMSLMLN